MYDTPTSLLPATVPAGIAGAGAIAFTGGTLFWIVLAVSRSSRPGAPCGASFRGTEKSDAKRDVGLVGRGNSAVSHCLSRGLGRLILGLALAGCLIWVLGSGPSGGSERAAVRSPLVDRSLFGAFVATGPGHTLYDDPTVLRDYEHLLGASVQVVSAFYGVGNVFPGSRERQLAAGGRRAVLLSWDLGSGRGTGSPPGRRAATTPT